MSADLREMLAGLGEQTRWMLDRLDASESLTAAERDEIVVFAAQHLRVVRGSSPLTVAKYGRHVASLLEWLHSTARDIRDLSAADLEDWLKYLYLERKYSATWRANHLAGVRAYLGWRELTGRGGASAARMVRPPRLPKTTRRRYSTEQLRKLFAALGQDTVIARRDRAVLGLFYVTGLRREELARLDLDALDIGQRVMRLTVNGKGAKQRVVSCTGPVVVWLRAWLADRDAVADADPAAVWLSLGAPRVCGARLSLRAIDGLARRAGVAAGIGPVSLHRLRVTFASDLYDQCVDIERIRTVLGHETIETTRKYIAVSERVQRTRLSHARMAEVMGGGIPAWAQEKIDSEAT